MKKRRGRSEEEKNCNSEIKLLFRTNAFESRNFKYLFKRTKERAIFIQS